MRLHSNWTLIQSRGENGCKGLVSADASIHICTYLLKLTFDNTSRLFFLKRYVRYAGPEVYDKENTFDVSCIINKVILN